MHDVFVTWTHNIAYLGVDENGYEEGGGSSDEDEQETVDVGGLPVPETPARSSSTGGSAARGGGAARGDRAGRVERGRAGGAGGGAVRVRE
jgi:hypothetical protein